MYHKDFTIIPYHGEYVAPWNNFQIEEYPNLCSDPSACGQEWCIPAATLYDPQLVDVIENSRVRVKLAVTDVSNEAMAALFSLIQRNLKNLQYLHVTLERDQLGYEKLCDAISQSETLLWIRVEIPQVRIPEEDLQKIIEATAANRCTFLLEILDDRGRYDFSVEQILENSTSLIQVKTSRAAHSPELVSVLERIEEMSKLLVWFNYNISN